MCLEPQEIQYIIWREYGVVMLKKLEHRLGLALISKARVSKSVNKSLALLGRKQVNVSVRMARISFGALLCRKKKP